MKQYLAVPEAAGLVGSSLIGTRIPALSLRAGLTPLIFSAFLTVGGTARSRV